MLSAVIQKDVYVSGLIGEIFGPIEVKFPHPHFLGPSAVTCRAAMGKKVLIPGTETAVISWDHWSSGNKAQSSLHTWLESENNCEFSVTFFSFSCYFSDLPRCVGRNVEEHSGAGYEALVPCHGMILSSLEDSLG